MNHYILPLLIVFALIGCEKASNEPKTIDKFCGTFSLSGAYEETQSIIPKNSATSKTFTKGSYSEKTVKISKISNTTAKVECDYNDFSLIESCYLSADWNSIQFKNFKTTFIDDGAITGNRGVVINILLQNDAATLQRGHLKWGTLYFVSFYNPYNSAMVNISRLYENTAIKQTAISQ